MSGPRPQPPPPQAANRFLAWFCRPALYEEIRGDLEEDFHDRVAADGLLRARLAYWGEVCFFMRAHVLRRRSNSLYARGPIMWKNYVLVALRRMRRHLGYAFINVMGLALGLACALLILAYVQDELRYDRHHAEADRIYRLINSYEGEDPNYAGIAKVNGPWGVTAAEVVPEVAQFTRFMFFGQALARHGDQEAYESGGFYADSTAFEVFTIPLLQGDPATALGAPEAVVLSESLAEAYFAGEDPLGQGWSLDGTLFTVTGVMADWPETAHFQARFLVSMASYTDPDHDDWIRWNQYYTYLLLHEGADPEAVASAFRARLPDYLGAAAENYAPALQPLTRIHLHSNLFREMGANGDIRYVRLFAIVALFILLIACINFMNLSTARAAGRAREVGIRKAAGARRGALVGQFLGESVLTAALAAMLAVALMPWLLPVFNALTGKTFTAVGLFTPAFVLGLSAVALLVGLGAGSYPAFVLSGFHPATVLKGGGATPGRARLRQGLVVFQFAISVGLIIATGVIQAQLGYIQDRPLGFDKEQIVTLPIRDDGMRDNAASIKARLLAHPNIVQVSISANAPGGGDYGIPALPEGIPEDERPAMRMLVIDHDFLDTYGMTLATGRAFDPARPADAGAYLLNEAAVEALGWLEDPLAKTIAMPAIGREAGPVIGVVQDFHFRSMHETIAPLMLFLAPTPGWLSFYSVKIHPAQVDETLAFLEETWAALDPAHPFTYRFFDAGFEALHEREQNLGTLLGYFTVLALLIACLGLFGLAAFMAQQRTKEIGIRKVMGASVTQLVGLLSVEFVRLVGIGLVVAAPVAYLVMDRWLQNFAYRTEMPWAVFVGAGLGALGVALLTVSYQALRAATADPVKVLRYE